MRKLPIKILIVLTAATLVAFISYSFTKKKSEGPAPIPTPTPPQTAGAPPAKELVPGAPKNVRFQIFGPVARPPATLPLYKPGPPYSPDEKVAQFASILGFGSPETQTDNVGAAHTAWTSNLGSIILTRDRSVRTMSYTRLRSAAEASSQTPDAIARAFLYDTLGLPRVFELQLVSVAPFVPEQILFDDPQPKLKQLIYRYLVDGSWPLIATNFNPDAIHMAIDERGAVRTLTMVFPPAYLTKLNDAGLLTLDRAVESLNNNLGLLLWSINERTKWGEPPSFSSVNIDGLIVSYYLDSEKNLVYPVYLFDGIGRNEKTLRVRYLLVASDID